MIIGFGFTKVLAERNPGVKGKISINNNVGITGIQELKMRVDPKKAAIKTLFKFESKYEPKLATISFEGEVISLLDKKMAEDIMKQWKKDKKLPPKFVTGIINPILDRCNIQSLILCKDLNLPAPIPLPKVNVENKLKAKPNKEEKKKK